MKILTKNSRPRAARATSVNASRTRKRRLRRVGVERERRAGGRRRATCRSEPRSHSPAEWQDGFSVMRAVHPTGWNPASGSPPPRKPTARNGARRARLPVRRLLEITWFQAGASAVGSSTGTPACVSPSPLIAVASWLSTASSIRACVGSIANSFKPRMNAIATIAAIPRA